MTRRAVTAAVVATLAVAPFAAGQTMDGRGRGLDALDEGKVMARLADAGMTALLDRDLDVYKVPPAARDQQKAVIQLQQLANATGLKPADRRALAERVARGIDPLVDKSTNPAQLQEQAHQLITAGVDPTVAELDYFGGNPAAQKQLTPVAQTVKHLLQRSGTLVAAQMNVIRNGMTTANINVQRPKLHALSPLKLVAAYRDQLTSYALALSLPPTDPRRATLADAAIAYLAQYDNPKSTIQPEVRFQAGKLQLVKGDYAAARATLDGVANAPAGGLTPGATPAQQNDARYFTAVADLLAGKLAEADADVSALETWQSTNYVPALSPDARDSVKATVAMLRFRLASARADAATDPAEKAKDNDQAVTILSTLLQEQNDPTLSDLVFDQLATRIPPNPDLAQLNPLALQALQQQGFDEYNKKDAEPANGPVLERAVAAARELGRRSGQPGVSPAVAANAAYFAAYALETKLHDDPAAADAFMDVMEHFPGETDKSQDSLQHAGALVFKLHRAAVARNAPDPVEAKLYDRFLPLAIASPYNQTQVAYDYAEVLRGRGKFADAAKTYAAVPTADKRYAAARFYEMVSLFSALGDATPLPADARKAAADRLQTLAVEVDQTAAAAAAAAPDDAARQPQLARVAIARIDAAISARRDLRDPAKSLQWLDGFEGKVAGYNDAKAFARLALQERVTADMELGKTTEATAQLVPLLQADPAAGEGLMFDLIQQIDHDFAAAKGASNVPAQRQQAANKATLSGFLVTYAQASHDPKTQAALPGYRLYDADSKRQAAELTEDPAAKAANLDAALKQYEALTTAGTPDPAAQLGTGLTQFDLGHFQAAVDSLGPVMTKVGQPMIDVDGQRVANPQYWETYYKQLRSMYEVGKAAPADPKAKGYLATAKQRVGAFFVLYGDKTGGPGYHDDFVQLKADMAGK